LARPIFHVEIARRAWLERRHRHSNAEKAWEVEIERRRAEVALVPAPLKHINGVADACSTR